MQVAGNEIVDLVVGQVSLFLACVDELLYIVFKSVFYGQSESNLRVDFVGLSL
jgi:hypothetical protein